MPDVFKRLVNFQSRGHIRTDQSWFNMAIKCFEFERLDGACRRQFKRLTGPGRSAALGPAAHHHRNARQADAHIDCGYGRGLAQENIRRGNSAKDAPIGASLSAAETVQTLKLALDIMRHPRSRLLYGGRRFFDNVLLVEKNGESLRK